MASAQAAPDVAPRAAAHDPARSMALLDQVLDPPVGPGYFSAAQDRAARGLRPSSGTRTWLMLFVCVAVGFLCTVAAATLRAPNPAAAETRRQLVSRIETAQAAGDAESTKVERLRGEIQALEQGVDPRRGEDGITQAGRDAGATAVHGPGIVVTLDDAPPQEQGVPGDGSTPQRINSRDLQFVVNGLWSAGAEAITVNGHRMTSTAAIRFAGEALIVDFRSLVPPYEVAAIGDRARLEAEVTDGQTGAYLTALRERFHLPSSVRQEKDLVAEPAERLSTRVASVPPTSTATAPGTDGSAPTTDGAETPPTAPTTKEGSR